MEGLEETDYLAVPDTLDRKVREDILVPLACLVSLVHQSLWREESPEPLEVAAFLASPDPEVTRVCQVHLVVRVCLDFLVSLSRVKDSQDSLGSPGNQDLQASLDRREKVESMDSLACLDQGVMMAHLVYLATLESLVGLVAKVYPETVMVILEHQDLKASQEIQASQVAVALMVHPVTTVFQEVQVSLDRRELLVKEDGLE